MPKGFENIWRILGSFPRMRMGEALNFDFPWGENPPPEEGHIDGEGKFKAGKKPQNPLKEEI
ncbi:MAG TPA: hypothetical protein VI957_00960 [Candidatus Paceibacterota bacterium]